jgi:copper homeostasis protein
MVKLEVCANGLGSAIAAQEGGAFRVELCDNLTEGGTTPSYGQIAVAKKRLNIEIWPIIRPRGGDFIYSDLEFEVMKQDILNCKDLGCDGVVVGILNKDNTIDEERCRILVALANPMLVAFHRAFDVSDDLFRAMEEIISLGFVRILSSGGADTAMLGADKLKALIKQANGRIELMPGAGINLSNAAEILELTGAKSIHASLSTMVPAEQSGVSVIAGLTDTPYRLTEKDVVRKMQSILKNL